jgi:hypothetical protein
VVKSSGRLSNGQGEVTRGHDSRVKVPKDTEDASKEMDSIKFRGQIVAADVLEANEESEDSDSGLIEYYVIRDANSVGVVDRSGEKMHFKKRPEEKPPYTNCGVASSIPDVSNTENGDESGTNKTEIESTISRPIVKQQEKTNQGQGIMDILGVSNNHDNIFDSGEFRQET